MARRLGPLLIAAGAILLWLSSRMTWATAAVEDDKSGSSTVDMVGSFWSLELIALTLVLLAGSVAVAALRRTSRRIVAVICALAAAAVAWSPVSLLTYGVDAARAQELLRAGSSDENAVNGAHISEWATVLSTEAAKAGPILAIFGAACALFGAMLLVRKPGVDKPRSTKYESPAARQERIAEELETTTDSGRVMWDALDADIDPTDVKRP
ncbi:TIGR02234 family membrane protein [Corynebacterium simulans]|uniref:TIGR02234 family membrane protein n=1 Tax=Corynebacterium simulans TaxID=146827 RepID=UPI00254D0C03|nr:TIGR02234 family membrane protein [Corynebacterium simulans]MDK7138208.1 TIGR02234 family membrane protein [Corynebacterium simulans]